MNIIIRNAQPEDLDAVTAIEVECFPPAEAAERETIFERIKAFPESFLVAENDGRMVGFINGCVTNDLVISDDMFHSTAHNIPSGKTQTVFGLDVVPEYQRRGIAGQLMRKFIQTAREAGRQRVILTCKEHLVHYYEGFGFINDGLSESTHGGAQWFNMTCPLMIRKLIEDPKESEVMEIRERIIAFNLERIEDKDHHDYIIRYGNDQGEFSAGIYFSIHGEWLEIDLLIVDENERAAGLGSKLLKDAEALALEKNCSMSFLTTFGFQARPFYEKHGYSVVYEQKSYPRTGSKYFMEKRLG